MPKKNVSFFQPYWISETLLVCSEDSSGWWNLLFLDVSEIEHILIKKRFEKNLKKLFLQNQFQIQFPKNQIHNLLKELFFEKH